MRRPNAAARMMDEAIELLTADERVMRLIPPCDEEWRAFATCAGLCHMLSDPRFRSAPLRRLFREDLSAALRPVFRECTCVEWIETVGARLFQPMPDMAALRGEEEESDAHPCRKIMLDEVQNWTAVRPFSAGASHATMVQ